MSVSNSTAVNEPTVIRGADVKPIWLLRDYFKPLISPVQTEGRFAMVESRSHVGEGSPPHIHHNEDEAFYILEGEMTFLAHDKLIRAGAGSFVYAPRKVIHNFTCTSKEPAKMLVMAAPAKFAEFAQAMSEPAGEFDEPPAITPEKIGRLMQIAPVYAIEMRMDHVMPTLITDASKPKKRIWAMGEDVSYLATADETGGQFTAAEIRTAPLGGPPPHAHHREDEIFYVIEGVHEVLLGETLHRVGPGDTVFIPRGTVHRFSNTHATERGRILSFHTPGGFEKFFDEIGAPYEQHPEPPPLPYMTPEQIRALFARHGMTA